jgi:hypothetical protein
MLILCIAERINTPALLGVRLVDFGGHSRNSTRKAVCAEDSTILMKISVLIAEMP